MSQELIKYTDVVEFPLTEDGKAKLLADTGMVSPTVYDPEVHHFDPSELNPFGGKVEEQFQQVLEVMQRRHAIRHPRKSDGLGIPRFKQGLVNRDFGVQTPEQGAEGVRADDPSWHPTHARQWLHNNGAGLVPVFTADPSRDFSRGPLPVAACMGALPYLVSPTAFSVKYHYGLARPQQIVGRALRGEIEAPNWFLDALEDLGITLENYQAWFQFIHPDHPDYIAMHAAVAAFSYACEVFFECTPEQRDAMHDYMGNVSHNRDNGGVHTFDASRDGSEVGFETTKVVLPSLVEYFGGDRDMVEERLAGLSLV